MAALPSRVAFLVEANTAIASGTNRIADLPGNIFRLFVFLGDLFSADVDDGKTICDLDLPAQVQGKDKVAYTKSRSEFLEKFLKDEKNALGREAIEELGLVAEDLLDIVDLFCEPRFIRFRSELLRTAPQPATVARVSARGPVAPSGKVTSR